MKRRKQTDKQEAAPPLTEPADAIWAAEALEERVRLIEKEFSDIPSCMEYRDALKQAINELRREAGKDDC